MTEDGGHGPDRTPSRRWIPIDTTIDDGVTQKFEIMFALGGGGAEPCEKKKNKSSLSRLHNVNLQRRPHTVQSMIR